MLLFVEIFIIALATGVFFFAGLQYSVGKMLRSRFAAGWAIGSFLVRTGITLGVFYWLSAGSAVRLLVCVGAFVAARILVFWVMRRAVRGGRRDGQGPLKKSPSPAIKEVSHATES